LCTELSRLLADLIDAGAPAAVTAAAIDRVVDVVAGNRTVLRNRGSAGLGRAVWGGAAAVLGTFAAVPVVALLVSAVDALAMDLAAITSGDIETLIGQVTALLLGDSTADGAHLIGGGLVGTVGAIILGFLTVVGAVAVWVALLIRAMLLYVVVVIAPICFAGLVWEPARGWFRRWLTMIVALVFTKLGVVLVFSLGVSAVGTAGLGDSSWEQLGQLFAGLVMLLMASLVPIACSKFFSFLGDESVQALHAGAAGGAARGADAVRGMANRPMDALRRQAVSERFGVPEHPQPQAVSIPRWLASDMIRYLYSGPHVRGENITRAC